MKDLTIEIEEKAKRYDEVIERANSLLSGNQIGNAWIYKLLPELKESKDEKIRKALIKYLEALDDEEIRYGVSFKEMRSWLEKQKTTEEALWYLKENHSPSEVSDFQAAMNIAVAKAYNKGYADELEKQDKNNIGISDATKQKLEDNLNKALEKETPESWNEFLDEQEPTDKVEPKFNVGDKIIHKELGGDYIHNPHKIIQVDILDKKYRLEGGLVAHFSEEDDWELVEQKPTKTSKFKVGDWVIYECGEDSAILQIKNIVDGTYEFTDDSTLNVVDENTLRLWTIQDAKDGDVLASDNGCPFVYKKSDGTGARLYCCVSIANNFCIDDGIIHCGFKNSAKPATKEQSDLLFTKMKDDGYEWDAEKKELKKIKIVK